MGAFALAPCHLAKPHTSRCPQQLVSTRGELCPYYCHNRPLGRSRRPKSRIRPIIRNLAMRLCAIRWQNSAAKISKMRFRRRRRASGRLFAYFGARRRKPALVFERSFSRKSPSSLVVHDELHGGFDVVSTNSGTEFAGLDPVFPPDFTTRKLVLRALMLDDTFGHSRFGFFRGEA